jgi:hypothetical protein
VYMKIREDQEANLVVITPIIVIAARANANESTEPPTVDV